MGERCTVEGTVQHVIFQNEENGYTVLGLLTEEGELVTVVGCIPCVAPGEKLTADGLWVSHPSYGQQFAAETVERLMPETEEELISYLSSGIIKGVGPATAERLVERFGGETLAVIEEEPERLSTVKGITSKRAMEISAAFRELTGLRRVMEFLARYELPVELAMRLYRTYGADALPRLRADPYLLAGERYGVAFADVDEIALSMGFGGDSPCRTEAAVLYELEHNLGNGHVFLPRPKLLAATEQLIGAPPELVEKVKNGEVTTNKAYQDLLKENQQLRTDRVEAMNQADRERARADRAESERDKARADQLSTAKDCNRLGLKASQEKDRADKAEARAKNAENQLSGSRQVAEAAKLRADKLQEENAALKKQPIAAVVDEEEVDRRAGEKAYEIAAGMTADYKAQQEQDARDAYDSIILAGRSITSIVQSAKMQFRKLPDDQRETAINQFVHTLASAQGEVSACL